MGKKAFIAIFILIFLASMLNGVLLINITNANPIPYGEPNPPTVIILSPVNSTYYQNDILLSLAVDAFSDFPDAYHIDGVSYRIDDQSVWIYTNHNYNTFSPQQFSANLTGISKREHTLTVSVDGSGHYYTSGDFQLTVYSVESNQTVTFTVTKDLQTTPYSLPTVSISPTFSPSPTLSPTPSPTPMQAPAVTPTPTPTLFMSNPFSLPPDQPTNQTNSNWLYVAIVVVAIVAAVLLVYFRKRRG